MSTICFYADTPECHFDKNLLQVKPITMGQKGNSYSSKILYNNSRLVLRFPSQLTYGINSGKYGKSMTYEILNPATINDMNKRAEYIRFLNFVNEYQATVLEMFYNIAKQTAPNDDIKFQLREIISNPKDKIITIIQPAKKDDIIDPSKPERVYITFNAMNPADPTKLKMSCHSFLNKALDINMVEGRGEYIPIVTLPDIVICPKKNSSGAAKFHVYAVSLFYNTESQADNKLLLGPQFKDVVEDDTELECVDD